jgi:hypothetical protein
VNSLRKVSSPLTGLLVLGLVACGGTGPDDNPVLDCTQVAPTQLSVGQEAIVDASDIGCVRIPAAGSAGAEYLYVALSGSGTVDSNGVSESFELTGGPPAVAAVSPRRASPRPAFLSTSRGPVRNAAFDAHLRARERALAAQPGAASLARARTQQAARVPPVPGEQRTFKVCETPECNTFVDATATAKVVTDGVAIFLDDAPPAGGFSQADLDAVGDLFDHQLYPIDTTAFGRESDIDNDGVVIVLLTQRINDLSPDCETTQSVILGYFFGLDLLPQFANSNGGEIFYGAVPDPSRPTCFAKDFITSHLSPLFIHEFQHMISFNQHALVRGGNAEETWLNEGLSHFAEELGGRLVPDADCPTFDSCESQFLEEGDLSNAFSYLRDTESSFLIEPGNSGGTLAERGANWLFVRWLADNFAATQPQGTELTRALVQTDRLGSANVTAVTGRPFDELVSEWQLTNYVDDLPGFTPVNPRLHYTSWNFRATYGTAFPLEPDPAPDGVYSHIGVLRGGSGRHVLIVQQPNAPEAGLKLTQEDGTSPLPASAAPRAVLLRIR